MQQASYRIVSYRPEYTPEIIEVQKNLWGSNQELSAAYLEWKYLRNPYIGEPLIYLAMQGERVVGMRGFMGAKWEFGPLRQTVVLPTAHDMVIAPDHRNRGLMALIMKAALRDLAEKGYTYVLSMTARPVTLMGQVTMGWRQVGSLQPIECRVTRTKSLVHRFLERMPLAVSVSRKLHNLAGKKPVWPSESQPNHFDVLDSISSRCNQKLGRHVAIATAPRPRDMAELAGRLDNDVRIRHVRDERYYAWRFHNPRSKYRFLFWSNTKMEGYLVLQAPALLSEEPIHIVDWEATSDQVRLDLLNSAIQLASDRTLVTWSATLGAKERRILEAAGFGRLEQTATWDPAAAVVRPVCDEMLRKEWTLGSQRLLDIGSWDFRMVHSGAF